MQDISEYSLSQIVWNEDLSVGIAELDQDHERFIAMVNALNQAIVDQEVRAQIRQRLRLIVLDAKNHFEHEQRLLGEYCYQDAANHAALHTQLLGQIIEAMSLFRNSELRERWIEAGLLIKGLLLDHLLNEDMRFRDFLRSRMPSSSD